MAKKTETDEAPKRKSKVQRHVAVWLLLAMIVTGFGGWGVANFGRSATSIGSVGSREITAQDYALALRQEMRRFSQQFGNELTLDMAQALGLDQQALQTLLLKTALEVEAQRIGLSVGDQVLAETVKAEQAFSGANGFDPQTYKLVLEQNGLTEKVYLARLRADMSRQVLSGAVTGGVVAPAALVDTLYAWAGERRSFTALQVTEARLPSPLAAPSEADLAAYHSANIAAFTRPEGKKITYAALEPEALASTIAIDDQAVAELYAQRADQYQVPEKRLVERLVFASQAEAQAAMDRLAAGTARFEDLVAERGLGLEDVDMGDVAAADLGAAGAAVFALAGPDVVGPLDSDLGPAIYRMNAILAAQSTPLDAVAADLRAELQREAAKRAIAQRSESIDDALAGGATLEDLARDEGMRLATIDYAPGAEDNDPLTADLKFARAVGQLAAGDFAEAILLDNGALVALRFEGEVPATPMPLETVRDRVAEAWRADALQAALAAQAQALKTQIEAGTSPAGLGPATAVPPRRRDEAAGDLPRAAVEAAFGLAQPGAVALVETPEWTGLVTLGAVLPAAFTGPAAQAARDDLGAQLRRSLAADIADLYGRALLGQVPVDLDQAAIGAVQASFR